MSDAAEVHKRALREMEGAARRDRLGRFLKTGETSAVSPTDEREGAVSPTDEEKRERE